MLAQVIAKPEIFTLEVIPLQSGVFGIFNCARTGQIVGVTYSHTMSPNTDESLTIDIRASGVSISPDFPIIIDSDYDAITTYLLTKRKFELPGGSQGTYVVAELTYVPGTDPKMDGVIIQVFVYFDHPQDYLKATPLPS